MAIAAQWNGWFSLTLLLPLLVFGVPAFFRWRHTLWLTPLALLLAAIGYFVGIIAIEAAYDRIYRHTGFYPHSEVDGIVTAVAALFWGSIYATLATTLAAFIGHLIYVSRTSSPDALWQSTIQKATHPPAPMEH